MEGRHRLIYALFSNGIIEPGCWVSRVKLLGDGELVHGHLVAFRVVERLTEIAVKQGDPRLQEGRRPHLLDGFLRLPSPEEGEASAQMGLPPTRH